MSGGWARVDKSASLSVAAVMLGTMEFLTELGLVVLGDVYALLQLVPPVSICALYKFKIKLS